MSNLRLEVLFNAVDKITGPIKNIIGGSQDLSSAFKKTSIDLKSLQSQQREFSKYSELTQAINKNRSSLKEYQSTINSLKQSARLGPLTDEQVKALTRAENGVKRLKKEYTSQKNEITGLVQGFNKAGISVNKLSEHENELKNKVHLTTMQLNRQRDALDRQSKAQQQYAKTQSQLSSISGAASKGLAVTGVAVGAAVVPVKLSIDFESAMADVAKVVDGLKDGAGKVTPAYAAMSKEILNMSSKLPMAAKDIAAIVAAGAQSGIAKTELVAFAESAVKMGVAFDITADQAGQSMAEMRSAFKMTQPEVIALADKINYLGNTSPNKADKIMEVVQRIGSLGEVGGFASSSIAAMAASLTSVEPDVAATGIKNMILALTKGESATKGQHNAYKKLGLDSSKISKSMQVDAEQTVETVIKAIKKLPKEEQVAITNDLFGSEALPVVMQYSKNLDTLQKNLHAVSNASVYAGSMEAEYAARAATTANNIQLLKNRLSTIAITIGNNLLPAVNNLVGVFSGVIGYVQAWADANPVLSATLTKIAVGIIAVIGGASVLALSVTTLLGPLALLKMTMVTLGGGTGILVGALKMLISPIKLIGMAFLWVGKAMLANPMVLAITAVVAVVAGAAYLIYKNWEPIKAFFSGLWSSVKSIFSSAVGAVSNSMNSISSTASSIWNKIKNAFSTGINFIKSIIQGIDSVFANNPILNLLLPFIGVPRMIIANWSSIKMFISNIWTSIYTVISNAINMIKTYVTAGFGIVVGYIYSVWSGITSAVSTAWQFISTSVSTGISVMSGYISAGFSTITGFIGSALGAIKNIVSVAWQGVCNLFMTYTPLGFIVSNFDSIFTFLSGIAGRMLAIGQNIIDGLINGIKSGFARLKGVWSEINNYMPSFMQKKMDIHSPSRVMAGLGGHVVDGISVGLDSRTNALRNQFAQTLGIFDTSQQELGLSNITPQFESRSAVRSGQRSVSIVSQDTIQIIVKAEPGQKVHVNTQDIAQQLEQYEKQKMARMAREYRDQE